MNLLFTPFSVRNLTLKNRIVLPPMCNYQAGTDGLATDWHDLHYATRAVGGTGLIIVEATAVCLEGRISDQDLGLWSDEQIPGLSRIVERIHKYGAKAGIQINHAGRKCTATVPEIEAPSSIPFDENSPSPKEMSLEAIRETVGQFAASAERALAAGFDLLQIHAAHGYLLSSFLSPLTNRRNDSYGGTPENRARILGEVVEAVRAVWPADKPLDLRVTAEDYAEGGNQPEDLAQMINLIKSRGIDMVNVSTGGLLPVVPKALPGYQIRHAEIIRRETGLPVAGGGLLYDRALIEEILEKEQADLVYLGRELLRNPYWPLLTASESGADVEWPKPYERARTRR